MGYRGRPLRGTVAYFVSSGIRGDVLGGHLRRTGGIGVLVVVLVLGYGLYTGVIGPEWFLGGDSGRTGRASGPSTASGAPEPPAAPAARDAAACRGCAHRQHGRLLARGVSALGRGRYAVRVERARRQLRREGRRPRPGWAGNRGGRGVFRLRWQVVGSLHRQDARGFRGRGHRPRRSAGQRLALRRGRLGWEREGSLRKRPRRAAFRG